MHKAAMVKQLDQKSPHPSRAVYMTWQNKKVCFAMIIAPVINV